MIADLQETEAEITYVIPESIPQSDRAVIHDPMVDDDDLAAALARTAGRILLELRGSALLQGKVLGETGDAVTHQWLARALRELRPDDGLLSEEEAADPARLEHRRIWIVDPLDGTREYSEGRQDWAVHVALVVDGSPTVSAVALPGIDEVFCTDGGSNLAAAPRGLRIAVSRSRPPAVAGFIAARLGAELVPMGSAGWKSMAVVRGEVHAYVHDGGQYEWDSAAPVGVANAVGLHTSSLDGAPMRFGKPDPWEPELLVCRPELTESILSAIAEFRKERLC